MGGMFEFAFQRSASILLSGDFGNINGATYPITIIRIII